MAIELKKRDYQILKESLKAKTDEKEIENNGQELICP